MSKKRILLGVSASVAAYKACELVRLLKKDGHSVRVVLSDNAHQFVGAATFQALSGETVYSAIGSSSGNGMEHINLTRQADVFLIAPATANTIAKIATGIADNLLTTLAAATTVPLLVAPAMNTQMWQNPANLANIALLRQRGIGVLGPAVGEQACGENGPGKMLEPWQLSDLLSDAWCQKSLAGKTVLLTAGATYEALDPVRGIINISSGKMGMALARACRQAGAKVILVQGKTQVAPPAGLTKVVTINSAVQMYQAVHDLVDGCDIFISAAAVADYRPKEYSAQKIKKTAAATAVIELETNPDILRSVAALPAAPFCVGFAAETQNLLLNGQNKKDSKKVPLLVANLVADAMQQDTNSVALIDSYGVSQLPRASKEQIAAQIVERLAKLLPAKLS